MESLLADYEAVVDAAIKNNVDPVSQSFSPNWDYIQAVFFSTTILTTIGLRTTRFGISPTGVRDKAQYQNR